MDKGQGRRSEDRTVERDILDVFHRSVVCLQGQGHLPGNAGHTLQQSLLIGKMHISTTLVCKTTSNWQFPRRQPKPKLQVPSKQIPKTPHLRRTQVWRHLTKQCMDTCKIFTLPGFENGPWSPRRSQCHDPQAFAEFLGSGRGAWWCSSRLVGRVLE
jgi:hypothetical protein